jgi:hypothetical protein
MYNGKNEDGECISWIVDGEGTLTCDTDGDGGARDDECEAANFPIGEIVDAGP